MQEENKVSNEKEIKEPKTTKQKVFFGLKIAGNVVFYVVILGLLLFSIMNINAGSTNGGFPNIFGKGFLAVQSNSMSTMENPIVALPDEYKSFGVGQFQKGDLLYADTLSSKDINKLHVGDVITFYDKSISYKDTKGKEISGALNSHRIVYIIYEDGTTSTVYKQSNTNSNVSSISVQGDYTAQSKGVFNPDDATKTALNYNLQSSGDVLTYTASALGDVVKGKVTGVGYGGGNTLQTIKDNWGWFFVLPVVIILIVEIIFVIRNIILLKDAKHEEQHASDIADLEATKEAMRAQILAELKAEQEKQLAAQATEAPAVEEKEAEEPDNSASEAVVAQEMTEENTQNKEE